MQPSYEQIRQLAQALPEEQRLSLANSLWESATEGGDAVIAEAWSEEIASRAAEVRAGSASTTSLEEFDVKLRAAVEQ